MANQTRYYRIDSTPTTIAMRGSSYEPNETHPPSSSLRALAWNNSLITSLLRPVVHDTSQLERHHL